MQKLTCCSCTAPNYGANKCIHRMSLLWVLLVFTSTIIGCGSAEAIKAYNYKLTKDTLEKAVSRVINSNPHIALIPIPRIVVVRKHPKDNSDTTPMVINAEEYTGKDKQSVLDYYSSMTKIKIQVGQIENTYVFRYAGSVQDWKTSRNSTIFIIGEN